MLHNGGKAQTKITVNNNGKTQSYTSDTLASYITENYENIEPARAKKIAEDIISNSNALGYTKAGFDGLILSHVNKGKANPGNIPYFTQGAENDLNQYKKDINLLKKFNLWQDDDPDDGLSNAQLMTLLRNGFTAQDINNLYTKAKHTNGGTKESREAKAITLLANLASNVSSKIPRETR